MLSNTCAPEKFSDYEMYAFRADAGPGEGEVDFFADRGRADAAADSGMRSLAPLSGTGGGLQTVDRVRTIFPETWLWSDSNAGYLATAWLLQKTNANFIYFLNTF